MTVESTDDAKSSPLGKIVAVASIAAGVQFGWALQLSLLTPYVQTLGVPHTWASFIWLCGPISGLLVQPIVGFYSDNCTSASGRRRPFIGVGALCVCFAVVLIGFAKDIGYRAGDAIDQKTKPRAVALFVVGFWILDVANNMLQGPCRAFLADLSGDDHRKMRIANGMFSFFMAVGNILGYAAGSVPGLFRILPFTKTVVCDTACANLKTCFLLDIVLLSLVTVFALATVSEKPYTLDDAKSGEESVPFIAQLTQSFKSLSRPMWILLLVTALNWIAWFPFFLYDTDWMGAEVYGGKVDGTDDQKRLYDLGVRAGAFGLMLNSIVLAFASLAVEPLGKLLGGVKRLWGLVNIILGAGLFMTIWITRVAEDWRESNGGALTVPPSNIKTPALAFFAVLGIPLSVTFSIPFALASIYCSVSGGGQGLSLGVVNMAIVVPQMIVSVASGPIDAAMGGGNLPAFGMGGISAIISAILAIFLLPNPPDNSLPTVPAGGH